jgi:ADP-heptose:LPS heptosyltransferase
LALDREALILRNRAMAEAFHQESLKHRVRGTGLQFLGKLPLPTRTQATLKQRILLIRPDTMSDALLSIPAIKALRTAQPQAEIHALVGQWSAEVLSHYPELDRVLTLEFPGFTRTPQENWQSPYGLAYQTARRLQRIRYNVAVILRPDHWWGAMVAKLAGIPTRIGYDVPNVGQFLTHPLKQEHEHVVLQNLRLVERLAGRIRADQAEYGFTITETASAWVNGYLSEWNIGERERIIVIHPSTDAWVKHWEEVQWAKAADILTEQLGVQIVFTGDESDMPLVSNIVSQMQQTAAMMVGDANIAQRAALYARALVVMGVESSAIHLAAAVGTPTVTLYGPSELAEVGIWGAAEKHIMVTQPIGCRPCRISDWGTDDKAYHPCVQEIPLERVLDAARRAAQHNRF